MYVRHNRFLDDISSDEYTPPNSHFINNSHRGVCVFSRRPTSEQGQRGVHLSSLGILVARSMRPRPWRHVATLKALAQEIYASLEQEAHGCAREAQEDDWEPARRFFEERRVRRTDSNTAGEWGRWSEELDDENGVSPYSFVPCFCAGIGRVLTFHFFSNKVR